jgi:hypothetical protein
MKDKYFIFGLLIWIFFISTGKGETYSGRPTYSEMESIVSYGLACSRGVYERCYATQYLPNPTYYVSPPTFIGTNGWYLSTIVMQSLDDKAKSLVQHYVDSTTWAPDKGSFGSHYTVTSLWPKLSIGNGVDQFTGTPAIGTNPPTYGDYPWRVYSKSLEERYKVLKALKWTVDSNRQVTNESWYGMISFWGAVTDLEKNTISNIITHDLTEIYSPSWEANAQSKQDMWSAYYEPTLQDGQYQYDNTNMVWLEGPAYNTNIYLTWSQVKTDFIENALWGYGSWCDWYPLWGDYTGFINIPTGGGVESNSVYTRFHEYTERMTNSISSDTVKPGTFAWAYVRPHYIYQWDSSYDTNSPPIYHMGPWDWAFCYYTGHATWRWYNNITNGVNNTFVGVYAIGGFQQPQPTPWFQPVGTTEVYQCSSYSDWLANHGEDYYWTYPREWLIEPQSPWNELSELASTNYVKLNVSVAGDWLYMEFGAGQHPVASLESMPPHPSEPLKGNAFWDNTGSRGTAKGILVNEAYVVRDWDFQYCK